MSAPRDVFMSSCDVIVSEGGEVNSRTHAQFVCIVIAVPPSSASRCTGCSNCIEMTVIKDVSSGQAKSVESRNHPQSPTIIAELQKLL